MTGIIWIVFFTYVVISIMMAARITHLDIRLRNLERVAEYRKNALRKVFPSVPMSKITHVDELV